MRKSIKVKIIVSICIAFTLLFTIFLHSIDGKIKNRVNLLNINLTNQLINARANQISNWLEQRKIELEMMSSSIIIFEMDEVKAIDYIRLMYREKSNLYTDMGIVQYGGYKLSDDGTGYYINEENYYKNALKENSIFKVSEPIDRNGEKVVTMLYKVGGVNRNIEYIYAEVPLEGLMRVASKISIYDGTGKILARNKSIHTDTNVIIDENVMVFETDIVTARGWSLNYYIPECNINEINREIHKYISRFLIVLLITVVTLLTISFKSIVEPIDQLKTLMGKVENGDLSVRLKTNRKDEIGSLITSFNSMTEKLEKLSYKDKVMRLRIMQEQIKPHFLYNTLDTIKWVALEDNTEEVVNLIDSLSAYFRIGLSSGKAFISLDEELEHIDSYLRIQKSRYEERLTYSIHYDERLLECMIMRVLLQPIVENAIIHGVNTMESGGKIAIYITQEKETIVINIMNNSEIHIQQLEEINDVLRSDIKSGTFKGYGLYNVNHRIKLEHGVNYGIELKSSNGWTTAVITIPKIKGENAKDV